MENTEAITQTHRGVILFRECAVKPDGLHVVSLGNRLSRPHGPLPISNYYTHTQAARDITMYTSLSTIMSHFKTLHNVNYSGSSFNTYYICYSITLLLIYQILYFQFEMNKREKLS